MADGPDYLISNDWQMRRLLNPTPAELSQEAEGRIFIYDGLMNDDIEDALGQEFERMESMMFIRIKDKTPEGDVVAYDNDDC
jgi:hypothetical protein